VGTLVAAAKAAPGWLAGLRKKLVEKGPVLVSRAREEWVDARPVVETEIKERVANVVNKLPGRRARTTEAAATAQASA
jgi:hypothetical protein